MRHGLISLLLSILANPENLIETTETASWLSSSQPILDRTEFSTDESRTIEFYVCVDSSRLCCSSEFCDGSDPATLEACVSVASEGCRYHVQWINEWRFRSLESQVVLRLRDLPATLTTACSIVMPLDHCFATWQVGNSLSQLSDAECLFDSGCRFSVDSSDKITTVSVTSQRPSIDNSTWAFTWKIQEEDSTITTATVLPSTVPQTPQACAVTQDATLSVRATRLFIKAVSDTTNPTEPLEISGGIKAFFSRPSFTEIIAFAFLVQYFVECR
eukprot:Gregarina_sp_Poly_1__8675@NODE_516_length_7810_cov_96_902622_g410_i0_p4_GENE_NODE_516_length_7810_cov_96_902622_g410_i0NODE_516_length_7810_cov_96_902622_g410_i0_p4_ORF_typecomplete_len273_score35_96_NODE_516_length_7810_cov_96_902622_g410_i036044422